MRQKHKTVVVVLSALCALAVSVVSRGDDTAPRLTFRASYDKYHAHADTAGGDAKSSLDVSLELRSTEGVRKSGLLVEKGEQCTYAVKGNLNMQCATVSMWVCPKNWNGDDRRYHHFFGVNGLDPRFRLSLYVPGEQTACLYMQFGERDTPEFRTFRVAGEVDWKQGEWHKLDACWDATTARLYVDGRLAQKLDLPNVQFPALDDRRFDVNTPWRGKPSRTHSPDDLTVVDEVKIWDGLLTAAQIAQNHAADKVSLSGEVARPLTRVPAVSGGGVKVDGALDEAAWSQAGCVPIRIKPDGFPHERECWALLLYGPDALYVGFRGPPQPRPLAAEVTQKDGPLWSDDSFELFLWSADPDEPDKAYQFIVNVNGAVFDMRGRDSHWNADVACAGRQGGDGWSVELSVPWAGLGEERPRAGTTWHANLCRNWQNPPPASPTYTAWAPFSGGYGNGKGELVFADAGAVRLALGEDLNAGRFVLEAATSGDTPLACVAAATAKGREPLRREVALTPGAGAKIEASLVGFKDGVLSVSVTAPATKTTWSRWAARLYVKEPIEVEYVPQVLGKLLTLRVDFGNLDPRRAEAVRSGKATLVVKATGPQPDVATTARFDVVGCGASSLFPCAGWTEGSISNSRSRLKGTRRSRRRGRCSNPRRPGSPPTRG